jgi:leucyl-tRNA synthetase
MDTFVDSSWYFLRYSSPRYEHGMFERHAADYWMPVDPYIGGIEHAVLHLLYARFYTKVLRDLGMTKVDEPFQALLSQGMVIKDGAKMSKSKGNVVDPDDLIRSLGADTARLFSLFAAPPEKDLDWNDHGVEGASRFLNRVWRFVIGNMSEIRGAGRPFTSSPYRARATPVLPQDRRAHAEATTAPDGRVQFSDAGRAFRRVIHEAIVRVTDDLDHDFHFNTAISAIMELTNALYAFEAFSGVPDSGVAEAERRALLREPVETVLLLLGPFCPHLAEELWSQLGHDESVFARPWPVPDATALVKDDVTVVVQVDGKVRGRLVLEVDAGETVVRERALDDDRVRPWVAGRRVERVVVVPNRLVNIVTS